MFYARVHSIILMSTLLELLWTKPDFRLKIVIGRQYRDKTGANSKELKILYIFIITMSINVFQRRMLKAEEGDDDGRLLMPEAGLLLTEDELLGGEGTVQDGNGMETESSGGVIEELKGVVLDHGADGGGQIVDIHEIVSGSTMTVLGDVDVKVPELSTQMMIATSSTTEPMHMVAGDGFMHEMSFACWQFREAGLFTDLILICQVDSIINIIAIC